MVQFIDKSLQTPNALQNIGLIDRGVRVLVGAGLIGVWLFYPMETVNLWFAALPLFGVLPLLSGILGWCPVYALFQTKSCGMDERNVCSTAPDQLLHLLGSKQQHHP